MRKLCSNCLLVFLLSCGACAAERADEASRGNALREREGPARLVAALTGFHGPEAVVYDSAQDAWFVSNMLGFGSFHDDNGYILRVSGDLRASAVLVSGSADGVTLHAPKGMALQGDTLWVADIDVLRGFDRRTGAPVAEIDLRGRALLLNDVALGPDGALYATDTGIQMIEHGVLYRGGDQVLRIAPGGAVSVVVAGEALRRPNGIAWDGHGQRWLVAAFDPFRGEVYALGAEGARRTLTHGPGNFDGLEVLPDGAVLFTSWKDSSLHLLHGGRDRRIVRGLVQPAEIGVDTRRGRVAVPQVILGRVHVYGLPGG